MAYSDLAYNQGVSFNNLNSGVSQGYFSAKTTIPSSSQMTTKSDCNTYVNIDPLYPPFGAKLDNQLVVKMDLKDNVATISITNNFFTGAITNVTVNGVSVTGGSFPLDIGNGTTAYTNQIGTYDILVYYADATNPSNYMRIQDSAYNDSCVDGFSSSGPGPYYVTFSSQVINTGIDVTIQSGDGACVGPLPYPPISTSPFSAVAVSRGTGQYMLAANTNLSGDSFTEGGLFRSTDYGATWSFIPGIVGYWYKVAISDNGEYMLALEYYGRAYRSTDYGASWTVISNFTSPGPLAPASQIQKFRGAAISGNGQYQIVTTGIFNYTAYTFQSLIFVSNDYGSTWFTSKRTEDGSENEWYSAAISSNGQIMLVTQGQLNYGQGGVWRSTNYGASWSFSASSSALGNPVDIGITADGVYSIVARYSNDYEPYLLKSPDQGVTWYNITAGASQNRWMRVAINDYLDLDIRAYALPNTNVSPEYLHLAITDLSEVQELSGLGTLGSKYYKSIANSDDGNYVLVGANNGLFLSNDGGWTWITIT